MSYARVKVTVQFPDGTPVSGASITAFNEDSWTKSGREKKGTSGPDGTYTWSNLDAGFGGSGNNYSFRARFDDNEKKVKWLGYASDKIKEDMSIVITLREANLEELVSYDLDEESKSVIAELDGGTPVLAAMRELSTTISKGLELSSVALSTSVLEGIIKLKLKQDDHWDDAWDEKTFGQLLELKEVKQLLGNGNYRRAKGIKEFRNAGIHPSGVRTSIEVALIAVDLIKDCSSTWFKRALHADTDNKSATTDKNTKEKSESG